MRSRVLRWSVHFTGSISLFLPNDSFSKERTLSTAVDSPSTTSRPRSSAVGIESFPLTSAASTASWVTTTTSPARGPAVCVAMAYPRASGLSRDHNLESPGSTEIEPAHRLSPSSPRADDETRPGARPPAHSPPGPSPPALRAAPGPAVCGRQFAGPSRRLAQGWFVIRLQALNQNVEVLPWHRPRAKLGS